MNPDGGSCSVHDGMPLVLFGRAGVEGGMGMDSLGVGRSTYLEASKHYKCDNNLNCLTQDPLENYLWTSKSGWGSFMSWHVVLAFGIQQQVFVCG